MTRFKFLGLISCWILLFQTGRAQQREVTITAQALQCLTGVMIHDITSPLVASRNYAYCMVAFYEAARITDPSYRSLAGQVNGLKALPQAPPGTYDGLLAGTQAFYRTAYALVFSKALFQQSWDSLSPQLKGNKTDTATLKRSIQLGDSVAAHILAWSRQDNYGKTRTLQRFTPSIQQGYWQQTPPDYMEAIEPYWNQIRPMTLKSANQFAIPRPAGYQSDTFKLACREVYDTGERLSEEQTRIANFWDCNPYATQTIGHLVYSVKKLSPGGHWIGITGVVAREKQPPLLKILSSYTLVSIALFDGFIACWDEKFRSNYIRPVTAIQRFISPVWQPLLQTPPFPEYPSGHSVISMAAAVALTAIYGQQVAYTDDVERPFGIEDRRFTSFYAAAEEAAISRLYGGIHFREAIENGKQLGQQVGDFVTRSIKFTP